MFKCEYKRCIKSKFNICLFLVATLPLLLSYFFSYEDKIYWEEQLRLAPSDLNPEMVRELVQGFNGFSFIYRFLFSYDYYIMFVLILLMGFGVFLGPVSLSHVKSGFGNMLQMRMEYGKYIKNIILAQIAYIATFLLVYFSVIFFVTFLIFPGSVINQSSINFNIADNNVFSAVILILAQIFLLFIFISLISVITVLSTAFCMNKYVLQCLPLMIYFIPLLISSTIGNMSVEISNIVKYIVSDNYLLSIQKYFNSLQDNTERILGIVILPIILLIFSFILYRLNVKKYGKDYLC